MKAADGYDQDKTGIKLLKKGRRGLSRMVFSRAGLLAILLLIQVALLLGVLRYYSELFPHYYAASLVFGVAMALYLINSSTNPTGKLTWLAVMTLMPAFGALLYLYTRSDVGHRVMRDRFSALTEETKTRVKQDEQALESFTEKVPEALGLARYLSHTGCHPVCAGTEVSYFPLGEDMFEEILRQLERAEKFIFLEFFIVDEGLMWGRILEVLARKAKEGVEVRLLYDGTCEFSRLPHNYPKRLKELGIQCKTFAPITPFVSTLYNYRDHRKILVIDGHTAFNGGVNLADEYINHIRLFGHWKDVGVMLRGEAARSFTLMFLQMWNLDEKTPEFDRYLDGPVPAADVPGFVIPYGDCPLDEERVGEWVYMDILNRARDYVYIMTPYLILDGEMENALKFAAERGVDVRIILPGIPDKKLAWSLAKSHYKSLLRSGVRIYEYSPGFVHAKSFVCDGREAVVGTINLDYRSLYHHFECATYMNGVSCVEDIHKDFLQTQALCRPVSFETVKKEKAWIKLAGYVMKLVAPLL